MTIRYPSADELDSGDWSETSGWGCSLYLVPAAETEDGIPRVERHPGVGNRGWPMPAHNHRWLSIGGYGPQTVGESVLDALRECESELLAASERYLGDEWDGQNRVGRWSHDEDAEMALDTRWDAQELAHYWEACDWYGPASIRWTDLCLEAGVDPERARGNGWEDLAEQVAAAVEPLQDEAVSGTAEYAREMAERYRAA